MLKSTLSRKLKAIGEEPVPEGHKKSNKGVTTFFFAPCKQQQVEQLLEQQGLSPAGVREEYAHKPTHWKANSHNDSFLTHSIFVAQYKDLLFVEVLRWPV